MRIEQEIFTMKRREIKRYHAIEKVLRRELKQVEAAEILGLSPRQVRRIVKRVRSYGERGVIHGLRGRASSRRLPEAMRERVLKLYAQRYEGFGPTLAAENLLMRDKITISKETLRGWLLAKGLWQAKAGRSRHLQWRERKAYYGEMVQMDGSHHDWLEGRGSWLVLMAQIDDATNEVSGRFYEYEGTVPALDSLKRYIDAHGIPSSIYLDRHTTYKSNGKLTIEDELAGRKAMSQFEVACSKLEIKVIHAHSPQAKGRVERLFRTLQDRLVKELRLARANTREEANVVLSNFLKKFNPRFSVTARERSNMHRPVPRGMRMNEILAIETTRCLRNDNTVAHNKQWYQVLTPVRAKDVLVQDRLDGRTAILAKGQRLEYKLIPGPEKKISIPRPCHPRRRFRPVEMHPWRLAQAQAVKIKEKRTFLLCPKQDISILP